MYKYERVSEYNDFKTEVQMLEAEPAQRIRLNVLQHNTGGSEGGKNHAATVTDPGREYI